MIKTILFDLDGTLLPMDQTVFTDKYFEALATYLAPYGYEPKQLIGGVWAGTKAMVQNDGRLTNEDVFWREFSGIFGEKVLKDKNAFDDFYENEFDKLKSVCGYTVQASEIVKYLKDDGYRLVLASNPVFPMTAQIKRMRWAGLNPDDFVLITAYDNSSYCKPNPLYYKQIAEKIGCKPSECLMVGNDTTEDMAAELMGMKVFLLTNCLLNSAQKDISTYKRGNFKQILSYLGML